MPKEQSEAGYQKVMHTVIQHAGIWDSECEFEASLGYIWDPDMGSEIIFLGNTDNLKLSNRVIVASVGTFWNNLACVEKGSGTLEGCTYVS